MTPTEIDNLPAGTELDAMVAKALGMEKGGLYEFADGRKPCRHFYPSRDWNNAMEAADLFGLFDGLHLTKEGDDWVVGEIDAMVDDFRRIGVAPTGPLAIARAIAKIGATK